jgi:5-methylcytosine-specific restriction protein A
MEWSKEELRASVVAYIEMRDLELQVKKYTKKRVYERLSEQFGRSPKAFEYRMQNISYVYSVLGRQWISGLKPAKNVGANVLPIIEELIGQHEGNLPIPQIEFEEQVSKLRREAKLSAPQGNANPNKQVKETTSFSRDPKVVAWVLKNSNGVCESCEEPAPFTKPDGDFYLEVHHLRRLADGGTDTTSNAVAVCPNCHRRLHFANNRDEVLADLYQRIDRLVEE